MELFHAHWFGQYKYDSFCMQSLQKRANKYLLLVTFETDDNYSIRFEISNNNSTIRFNSK